MKRNATPVADKAKDTRAVKQVQVIARYEVKRDRSHRPQVGHVAYLVRSSDGKGEYCTTLVHGKASGCTCPARKPCYHMKQLEKIEAARVTKTVPQMSAVCPVDASNMPTVCPQDATHEEEEFSEATVDRWTEEALSREAYVAAFSPNYENSCHYLA